MFKKFLFLLIILIIPTKTFAKDAVIKSLDNGFKVILYKDDTAPLVAMQLWVTHGSTSETDREAGVAHFLEHLTFRSKDIAKRIEALGGDINAYTSFDKTVYHLTIPKEYWEEGLRVLQDILLKTSFDEKSFSEEKSVILEEMKRSFDSPQKVLYNLYFETALKNHPARRPVIGFEKTIKDITREEVQAFYKRFYSPKTSYLVMVGDIDENTFKKAADLFGAPVDTKDALVQLAETEKPRVSVAVKSMNVASCYLMLGVPTPEIKDSYVPAIDVLSFIYGESSTSLLKERLKEEKQLVNYIYSYQMSMKDFGFFVVQTNFSCDRSEKVMEELTRLLFKEPITFSEEGLKKTIKSYESNYFFSKERFTDIAGDLGSSYFYYGDVDYSKKYIEEIKKVKIDDLQRVKGKFLTPEKVTAVMVTPESYKIEAERLLQKNFLNLPKPEELKQLTLKNGATLIIKKKQNVPTFGFTILSLAGSRTEEKATAGLSNFTLSCLLRGTKSMSYKEISERIEALGGTISGFSTKNLSGIKGKFISESFGEAVKLLGDILVNFSPSKEEVEKVKKLVLADIRKKGENPTRLLKELLFSTLYPEGPYGFPQEGYEESVRNFDARSIKRHFIEIFSPERLVIVFSGDLPEDAAMVLTSEFERLERYSKNEKAVSLKPQPKENQKIIEGDYNQTHIIISFPVPGMTSEERPYLQLLSTILSNQSGRLFTKLRDEEGLAYALGAFMYEAPEGSLFNLYIGTSPEKAEKAKQGLFEELEKTLKEGILEEERQKAVRQIITDISQSLQENVDISSVYANNRLFFNDPFYFMSYQEKIKGIKTEEITSKAKNFLKKENAVTVIVQGKTKP